MLPPSVASLKCSFTASTSLCWLPFTLQIVSHCTYSERPSLATLLTDVASSIACRRRFVGMFPSCLYTKISSQETSFSRTPLFTGLVVSGHVEFSVAADILLAVSAGVGTTEIGRCRRSCFRVLSAKINPNQSDGFTFCLQRVLSIGHEAFCLMDMMHSWGYDPCSFVVKRERQLKVYSVLRFSCAKINGFSLFVCYP
ncbi:hypothetical protein KP509_25G051500 [Ceratopteris richardii]|uniref:Uncharacterized protein n=1 Tax=Ceratopteris richardii TaxID=49495 RepID=A0A8T2RQC2_CERRI|nr:hypothetical protein KP509_25G051500 [Ceratopteris richardii]